MILLLLVLVALLYFPALRRGVGAALYGVTLVFVLTVLGGTVGALLALVVCSTMFVRGFWRRSSRAGRDCPLSARSGTASGTRRTRL